MSSSAFPFEPHKLLDDLGRITQQFKTWLDTEPEIDIMDQISIDNHLALLHLCFGAWKTKHGSTCGRTNRVETIIHTPFRF